MSARTPSSAAAAELHRSLLHAVDAGGPTADDELAQELAAFERAERERLGLSEERRHWTEPMTDPSVRRAERGHVTLLLGGLTAAQDLLVEGALRGLGYRTKHLPAPDNAALRLGKEFGNRGQCNPTYYTVGNLLAHLTRLRDEEKMAVEEIVRGHVFVTAGACGPCRFGMYITEFRKALRDAGFEGFRVMLFQQQGGLSQVSGEDSGLQFNSVFFAQIVKAVIAGDVINALGYRIRPYEVVPGATEKALEASKKILYAALSERRSIHWALWRCRKLFAAIQVDWLRARPKASIIGEFWAMTTEGDGNYRLQQFLESEGAENDIQLTTAWLLYSLWEVGRDTRVREGLRAPDGGRAGLASMGPFDVARRRLLLRAAEKALHLAFQSFAWPAGLFDYSLPDMYRLADVADPYYSNELRGGEGHLEVGKLILNVTDAKAHLTVSVKPFGCMPSSGVSDGVQTLVQAHHPGALFCAVETSGDGAANFYSRVQMSLFKARHLAQEELSRALEECGVSESEVRAYLESHPRLASALHRAPHAKGMVGTAANLVMEMAPRLRRSSLERAARSAVSAASRARKAAGLLTEGTAALAAFAASPAAWQKVREDVALLAAMGARAQGARGRDATTGPGRLETALGR